MEAGEDPAAFWRLEVAFLAGAFFCATAVLFFLEAFAFFPPASPLFVPALVAEDLPPDPLAAPPLDVFFFLDFLAFGLIWRLRRLSEKAQI